MFRCSVWIEVLRFVWLVISMIFDCVISLGLLNRFMLLLLGRCRFSSIRLGGCIVRLVWVFCSVWV